MKRYENLDILFGKADLFFGEAALDESHHVRGSHGRPPRKPLTGAIFERDMPLAWRHVAHSRIDEKKVEDGDS
jgi:hypothetical protein